MIQSRIVFTSPSLAGLRWLVDPGRDVPSDIKAVLLGEIFGSPKAVIVGVMPGTTALVITEEGIPPIPGRKALKTLVGRALSPNRSPTLISLVTGKNTWKSARTLA